MTVHIGSKIYTEYKKYTYTSWTMPVLAANGTVGGSSYAARASSEFSNHNAWKAFNGTNTSKDDCWEANTRDTQQWLEFYSPDTLELNTIKFTNRRQQYVTVFNPILVTGSIDRRNYFEIGRITPPSATQDAQYTLTVSSPQNKHCKRFQTTSDGTLLGDGAARPNFGRIEFTGKKVTGTTNGSASDYDYTVFHDGKIEDIYFGKTKISKIYKGSTLVYAASVPDTDFLKQPDFSTAESIQDGIASSFTLDDGYLCLYNNRTSQAIKTCDICPDSNFSSSNTIRIMYMKHLSGISNPCGGSIFPVPRGWWWKTTNMATGFSCYAKTAPGGRIPYKNRFKLTRLPDYTTGFSIDQNEIIYATKDQWLNSYGSNRKIEIATKSDMSDAVTIAEGASSATQEPSTMVFIEEGLYFRTSGTNNTRFLCKGV